MTVWAALAGGCTRRLVQLYKPGKKMHRNDGLHFFLAPISTHLPGAAARPEWRLRHGISISPYCRFPYLDLFNKPTGEATPEPARNRIAHTQSNRNGLQPAFVPIGFTISARSKSSSSLLCLPQKLIPIIRFTGRDCRWTNFHEEGTQR